MSTALRRDPRRDPQPDDRLELGGIVWRVLSADPERVAWRVEGMDEDHECSLAQWRRLKAESRVLARRDIKPANISPRDAGALYGVSTLTAAPDGWRRAQHRDQLHEAAGLARSSCQRAIDSLTASGHVERQHVGQSARMPEGYRLTASGQALVSRCGPVVGQPRASYRASPGQSCLVLPPAELTEKGQRQQEKPGPASGQIAGQPLVTLVDRLEQEAPGLVARVLLAMEAYLLSQASAPRTPAAPHAADPPSSASCACGPMALRTRDADGVQFYACSTWTSAGGGCGAPTVSIGGQPSRPIAPAKPDHEAERRAAESRAIIEATEAASRAEQASRTRATLERMARKVTA